MSSRVPGYTGTGVVARQSSVCDTVPIEAEPECTSDSDCPSGMVCENGTCVEADTGGCTSDADCPSGMVCENGTCVEGGGGGGGNGDDGGNGGGFDRRTLAAVGVVGLGAAYYYTRR